MRREGWRADDARGGMRAEDGFHATIQELGQELDSLRGTGANLPADPSSERECSPAPEPHPHPPLRPQPLPRIDSPPASSNLKPGLADERRDEECDASLAATLARKEYEVSVLLKKLAGVSKDAAAAGERCRALQGKVAGLEAEGACLRAECSELADDASEKQLRAGVLEAEVATLRAALEKVQTQAQGEGARAEGEGKETEAGRVEQGEASAVSALLAEVQSLRDEVRVRGLPVCSRAVCSRLHVVCV